MSKAVLVFDMPNGCNDCDIMCQQYYATIKNKELKAGMKPHDCPLREIPEKYDLSDDNDDFDDGWSRGFNYCIDRILDMF